MKVLQNDYILKTLDLPTIEWKQYFENTELEQDLLWTIKLEEIPGSEEIKESEKKRHFLFPWLKHTGDHRNQSTGLIGVDSTKAKEFGDKMLKKMDPKKQLLFYYPYYTVVKSGILDINRSRIVIEGTVGDIENMVIHNRIEVTMIFSDEDVSIVGDEKFFAQEEVLPLIDYGREIRKMAAKDIELGKNIQLYFSYVYRTSDVLKIQGDLQIIFYKFKLF